MSHVYNYVNPLGEVIDISYNNIGKLRNTVNTRNAQVKDSEQKNESNNFQLTMWSIVASLLILALVILLRNVKNF